MFCEKCGKEIADNAMFCPYCGQQLNGYNINGYTYTVNTGNTTNTDNTTPGKKKKRTWIWILLIVLIVGSLLRNCGKSHDETGSTSKGNTASESVEDYSDKPVWSKEYLFWYIESSDVNMNLFSEVKSAQKILNKVQKFDDAKNLTTESSLFKGSSYSLTTEGTGLVYMGGERKNKPDGLGGIWRSYQVGDVTVQKLVYAGYFSKGQYDGNGILFKDYDDSAVQNTFDTISSMYGWNADNAQKYCEEYLESIAYIGDFDKGDQTGKGVYFQYPYMEYLEYENSDDAQEVINTSDIDIYKGSFKDGKCSGKFKIYHDRYLIYDGDMAKDQMDGKGTIYFEDSKQIRYKGGWKKGQYDGKGTLYDENGEVQYKGKWDNGDYAS